MTDTSGTHALFVTDFDGTLYRGDGRIHPGDTEALSELGGAGVLRAVATGRSWESYRHTAEGFDLPVDYVIFSSGAGLMHPETGTIECAAALQPPQIREILSVFEELDLDYMIHEPIPDTHRFFYRAGRKKNADFERRCALYDEHCSPLPDDYLSSGSRATQFIAILPPGGLETVETVKKHLRNYSVVRTTSPLDGRSTWIEVFSKGVSKSSGVARLCTRFHISRERVCAVGNDYNDLDLLEWAAWAFVPDTAPPELRSTYRRIPDRDGAAISGAAHLWLEYLKGDLSGNG